MRTPGRCTNTDHCWLGNARRAVHVQIGQPFVCPACQEDLKAPPIYAFSASGFAGAAAICLGLLMAAGGAGYGLVKIAGQLPVSRFQALWQPKPVPGHTAPVLLADTRPVAVPSLPPAPAPDVRQAELTPGAGRPSPVLPVPTPLLAPPLARAATDTVAAALPAAGGTAPSPEDGALQAGGIMPAMLSASSAQLAQAAADALASGRPRAAPVPWPVAVTRPLVLPVTWSRPKPPEDDNPIFSSPSPHRIHTVRVRHPHGANRPSGAPETDPGATL